MTAKSEYRLRRAVLFTAAAIVTFYCAPSRADYDTGYQKFESPYFELKNENTQSNPPYYSLVSLPVLIADWVGNNDEAKQILPTLRTFKHPKDFDRLFERRPPSGGMTFGHWFELHKLVTEIAQRDYTLFHSDDLSLSHLEQLPPGAGVILENLFPHERELDPIPVGAQHTSGACTPPLGLSLRDVQRSFGPENFSQIDLWPQPHPFKDLAQEAQVLLKTWYTKTAQEDPIVSVARLEQKLGERLPATAENKSKIRLFSHYLLSHLRMTPLITQSPRTLGDPRALGRAVLEPRLFRKNWENNGLTAQMEAFENKAHPYDMSKKTDQYEQSVQLALGPLAFQYLSQALRDKYASAVTTLTQETRFYHYVLRDTRHNPQDPKIHDWIKTFVTFRANQAMGSQVLAPENTAGEGLYVAVDTISSYSYGKGDPALYEIAMKPGTRILTIRGEMADWSIVKKLQILGCSDYGLTSLVRSSTPICRELAQKVFQDLKIDLFHYLGNMKECTRSAWDSYAWLVLVSPKNVDWTNTNLHTRAGSTSSPENRRLMLAQASLHPYLKLGSKDPAEVKASPAEIEAYRKKYQLGCQPQ
ncbi:hypothetical protein WDW37_11035 [Bdellovibrionota bacterium FG-1]